MSSSPGGPVDDPDSSDSDDVLAPRADDWDGDWAWAHAEADASAEPPAPVDPADWEWAHPEPPAEPAAIDPSTVGGILVVHNAERWLARTLVALARSTTRPAQIVAVDTGSSDGSAEILRKGVADGVLQQVIDGSATDAVATAIQAGNAAMPDEVRWLWLLHDDAEPARDCLEALCAAAAFEPEPAIVVPTLLWPRRRNHPDRIQEAGQSITVTGTRLTGVEVGEIDQQQLESRRVLGGSTAGLLVRRDVLAELGGLDPELPVHRTGLALGWRATEHGHRVDAAPAARLWHRQAGLSGDRTSRLDRRPRVADRVAGMRLVLAHSRRPVLAVLGLVLAALARMVGSLAGKAPRAAVDQLVAVWTLLRTRGHTATLRERAAGGDPALSAGLRPGVRGSWRSAVRTVASAFGNRRHDRADDAAPDTSLDDLTGDDFAGGRRRGRWLDPRLGFAVLALVGVAGGLRLLGAGQLISANLLPAPHSLADAWAAWLRPTPSLPGANAPWLGWSAVASTLAAGRPDLVPWLVVFAGVPVAALCAYPLVKRLIGARGPQSSAVTAWAATVLSCAWGLLLVLTGALPRGALDTVAAALLLPLAGWAGWAWLRDQGSGAQRWRAPAALAAIAGVLIGVQPVLWVALLVGVVYVVVCRPRTWPAGVFVLVTAAVPLVGWWPRLRHDPARLLTAADPVFLVDAGGPAVLLGRTAASGAPPWTISIIAGAAWWLAVVAAVVVLVRRRAGGVVGVGLGPAFLAAAAWLPRLTLRIAGQPVTASGDLFALLGFGALGCVIALALRLPAPDAAAGGPVRPNWPARGLVGALVVAVLTPLVGWAVTGNRPMHTQTSMLPSYVVNDQLSARQTRVLLVDLTATPVGWNVTDAGSPQWGSAEHGLRLPDPRQNDLAQQLVAQIATAGPADDVVNRLTALGIGTLAVRGADAQVATALDDVAGLSGAPIDDTTTAWSVTGLPARASVLESVAAVSGTPLNRDRLASGSTSRVVVLAEPRDARWRAEIDGRRLAPVTVTHDSWRQAFATGSPGQAGGRVSWSMAPSVWPAVVQAGVLLGLLLIVAPTAQAIDTRRRPARATDDAPDDEGGRR